MRIDTPHKAVYATRPDTPTTEETMSTRYSRITHGVTFGPSISISRFLEYVVPRFWALFEAFGEARQMGNFQIFSMRGSVLMIL